MADGDHVRRVFGAKMEANMQPKGHENFKPDLSVLDALLLQKARADRAISRQNAATNNDPYEYDLESSSSSSQSNKMYRRAEVLSHELQRLYGATANDKLSMMTHKPRIHPYLLAPIQVDDTNPFNSKLIDSVLQDRHAEHESKREQFSQQLHNLNNERKRLLEEQEKYKKQNGASRDPSAPYSQVSEIPDWTFTFETVPPPKPLPPSPTSAHSIDSVIHEVRKNYAKQREQYYFMRRNHEAEVKRLEKLAAPYQGEFGIHTYKKTQLGNYYMFRELVENEIEKFLDNLFKANVHAYSKNTQQALIQADKRDTENYRKALFHDNISVLLSDQIFFEVTRKLTVEAVKEFFYISAISTNISDKVLMNTAEIIATGNEDGRDEDDPMFSAVTRLYFSIQEDRKRERNSLWKHTQYVHLIGQDTLTEIEADEQGVDYIEFSDITPTEIKSTEPHSLDTIEERDYKDTIQRYRTYEMNYWKNITAKLFTIPVHRQCRGICSTKISHNHKFMAVGTYHGDIIIYDLRIFPWKPIRAVYNINTKVEDPVIDISWSLDGSQLITINLLGTLNLWSFNAGSVSKDDLKGLGLGQADLGGFYTPQLVRQLEMDVDDGDFLYASGPLELLGVHSGKFGPVTACFHPSITMFGTQRNMCVALENGDILKCDVESRLHADISVYKETPRVYQSNVRPGVPSYLGANVEAELFRAHSHPVIFVGYIDHLTYMVTVDSRGYINVWKYSKSTVNEYNWFKPWRRLRIRQYKTMYAPVGSAKPNLIFSDHFGRRKSREQIAAMRKAAEETFAETKLQHPWHSEILVEQKVRTRIYKPGGMIAENGALFHIVSRHLGTDQIATYLSRLYAPVKVAYSRFYGVKQSPCGRELVILKLYPAHVPKPAHFTILRFNLQELKMADYRKDMFISEEDYEYYLRNEVIHWDFTKVYGPTGSDYLFLNRNGQLEAFSLNTGQMVLKVIDPKRKPPDPFSGCRINNKTVKISPNSRVVCAGTRGTIYIGFYEKLQDSLRVLQLQDKNTDTERRAMWKVFSSIPDHRNVAKEKRVNLEDFYLEDIQHPRVYARNIILEAMDNALEKKSTFGGKVTDEQIAEDQILNYLSLQDHVPKLVTQDDKNVAKPRGDDLLLADGAQTVPPTRASLVETLTPGISDYGSQRTSLQVPSHERRGSLLAAERRASMAPPRERSRPSAPVSGDQRRASLDVPSGDRRRASLAPPGAGGGLTPERRASLVAAERRASNVAQAQEQERERIASVRVQKEQEQQADQERRPSHAGAPKQSGQERHPSNAPAGQQAKRLSQERKPSAKQAPQKQSSAQKPPPHFKQSGAKRSGNK